MCRDALLATLPALGLPYGLTVHDLNFACPTTTMLGADGFWCGARGDVGACEACAGGENPWEWRERHRALVARGGVRHRAVALGGGHVPRVAFRSPSTSSRTVRPGCGRAPRRPRTAPRRHHRRARCPGCCCPPTTCRPSRSSARSAPTRARAASSALTALARARGSWLRFVVIGYLDRQSGPWQSDDARLTVHGRYDPNAGCRGCSTTTALRWSRIRPTGGELQLHAVRGRGPPAPRGRAADRRAGPSASITPAPGSC